MVLCRRGRHNPIPISLASGLLALSFVLGIRDTTVFAAASREKAQSVAVRTRGRQVGKRAESAEVHCMHSIVYMRCG